MGTRTITIIIPSQCHTSHITITMPFGCMSTPQQQTHHHLPTTHPIQELLFLSSVIGWRQVVACLGRRRIETNTGHCHDFPLQMMVRQHCSLNGKIAYHCPTVTFLRPLSLIIRDSSSLNRDRIPLPFIIQWPMPQNTMPVIGGRW